MNDRSMEANGAAPEKPTRETASVDLPTRSQRQWLMRGLDQPGGKLPLFDRNGQEISARTVRACLEKGWVEPWFSNPLKPDWLVCKLTDAGRAVVAAADGST